MEYPVAYRDSKEAGLYLVKKCLVKEGLFGYTMDDLPPPSTIKGPTLLGQKVAAIKSTTIKQTSVKQELS